MAWRVVRLWEGHNIHVCKEDCGPYKAGGDVRLYMQHSCVAKLIMFRWYNGWLCYPQLDQKDYWSHYRE